MFDWIYLAILQFGGGNKSQQIKKKLGREPEYWFGTTVLWKMKYQSRIFHAFSRNEYDLMDSAKYFLSSLDRIGCDGYTPTQNDVLHLRIPTSGIIEYIFKIPHRKESIQLRIVDVGGQKTERRKWVHCFDDVKSVIFLTALSEFDRLPTQEDEEGTRLEESMHLFQVIFSKVE